ncbi:hypothetical protein EGR_04571 [Echinococcus granulosus]|uniref:Uncharacterized protein n=1 Tax=Echinococcus granulosus TaxID=6210 RepID=W6UQH1_ECHGR|nr:hypothetical protein EGR_04571 [Echinococcus granulosus]EUB60552.1 hypothetical protein EGR_04571 [Echinococcus granulosus]
MGPPFTFPLQIKAGKMPMHSKLSVIEVDIIPLFLLPPTLKIQLEPLPIQNPRCTVASFASTFLLLLYTNNVNLDLTLHLWQPISVCISVDSRPAVEGCRQRLETIYGINKRHFDHSDCETREKGTNDFMKSVRNHTRQKSIVMRFIQVSFIQQLESMRWYLVVLVFTLQVDKTRFIRQESIGHHHHHQSNATNKAVHPLTETVACTLVEFLIHFLSLDTYKRTQIKLQQVPAPASHSGPDFFLFSPAIFIWKLLCTRIILYWHNKYEFLESEDVSTTRSLIQAEIDFRNKHHAI